MSETEGSGGSAPESSGSGPSVDLGAEIKNMPASEKLLGLAGIATLVGGIIVGKYFWKALFNHRFFPTCAFLGAAIALALIALQLFNVKLLDAKQRKWALVGAGMLPLLGYVIDELERMSFGGVLLLAGAIAMAIAAVRLSGYQRKAK